MAIFDNKFKWAPLPEHLFTLDADGFSPWSRMTASEQALYPPLYWLCNESKPRGTAETTSATLREVTGLDRNYLRKSIATLKDRRFIRATALDKRGQRYRFQILDLDGNPLTGESVPRTLKESNAQADGNRARGFVPGPARISWESEEQSNSESEPGKESSEHD